MKRCQRPSTRTDSLLRRAASQSGHTLVPHFAGTSILFSLILPPSSTPRRTATTCLPQAAARDSIVRSLSLSRCPSTTLVQRGADLLSPWSGSNARGVVQPPGGLADLTRREARIRRPTAVEAPAAWASWASSSPMRALSFRDRPFLSEPLYGRPNSPGLTGSVKLVRFDIPWSPPTAPQRITPTTGGLTTRRSFYSSLSVTPTPA